VGEVRAKEKKRSYWKYLLFFNEILATILDVLVPSAVRVWRTIIHFFVMFFLFYVLVDYLSKYITFSVDYDRLFILIGVISLGLALHGWWIRYRRGAMVSK
jgi:hypothetical protein